MPDTETDIAFSDEILTDFEFTENGERNEEIEKAENTNADEQGSPFNTAESIAEVSGTDAALHAILEQKGGRTEDWEVFDKDLDRGTGFMFDGENIRDPEGNVWNSLDAGLHQELVALWSEGAADTFLLPDYVERTEEKETLYVTALHLERDSGEVTWTIVSHETALHKDEEDRAAQREHARAAEVTVAPWEKVFAETERDDIVEESTEAMLAEAQVDLEVETSEDVSNQEKRKLAADAELTTMLQEILGFSQEKPAQQETREERIEVPPTPSTHKPSTTQPSPSTRSPAALTLNGISVTYVA